MTDSLHYTARPAQTGPDGALGTNVLSRERGAPPTQAVLTVAYDFRLIELGTSAIEMIRK